MGEIRGWVGSVDCKASRASRNPDRTGVDRPLDPVESSGTAQTGAFQPGPGCVDLGTWKIPLSTVDTSPSASLQEHSPPEARSPTDRSGSIPTTDRSRCVVAAVEMRFSGPTRECTSGLQ